jgi:hypothetical protein
MSDRGRLGRTARQQAKNTRHSVSAELGSTRTCGLHLRKDNLMDAKEARVQTSRPTYLSQSPTLSLIHE